MAFDVDRFVRLRPYLYHITARANRTAIERSMLLEPAAQLMRRAARPDLLRWRRPEAVTIRVGPDEIVLKDQRPLIEANLSLDGSWELGDLVEYLNEHVFFWPGRADGPIVHGARLLDRYEADAPLVLRVPTGDLLAANRGAEPLFCPFNSGAPRQQGGRRARRGPNLFSPADRFARRESEVVELGFRSAIVLPESTEAHGPSGWTAVGPRAA
jgi:hypothetical protein